MRGMIHFDSRTHITRGVKRDIAGRNRTIICIVSFKAARMLLRMKRRQHTYCTKVATHAQNTDTYRHNCIAFAHTLFPPFAELAQDT